MEYLILLILIVAPLVYAIVQLAGMHKERCAEIAFSDQYFNERAKQVVREMRESRNAL